MPEPRWLSVEMISAIHDESLAAFGGLPGLRDAGLLDSAAHRARQLFHSGGTVTQFDLAAAYCAGTIPNHPFLDGNKRAGLLAARAFLFLNGYSLEPSEADEVRVIVQFAAGELDEAFLSAWLAANSARSIAPRARRQRGRRQQP